MAVSMPLITPFPLAPDLPAPVPLAGRLRVMVTRPADDAAHWVEALSRRGHEAVALPLIAIAAADSVEELSALANAWQQVAQGRHAAVMFSSGNAVSRFFAARPPDLTLPDATRLWAPGPGTARALEIAGAAEAQIDSPADDAAQFDSEHLWRVVAPQVSAGSRVLFVRGGDENGKARGRDWLQQTVRTAGAAWDEVVAYRRACPVWGEVERAQALRLSGVAASTGSPDAVWLFSSSEGIANLVRLLPGTRWNASRAVVTHERIADAARVAGFGSVTVSSPTLGAVLASIESLQ